MLRQTLCTGEHTEDIRKVDAALCIVCRQRKPIHILYAVLKIRCHSGILYPSIYKAKKGGNLSPKKQLFLLFFCIFFASGYK
jgi:hypothetical protein